MNQTTQGTCPTCNKPLAGRGKCRSYNHVAISPRKVGGVYFNGYWGIEYTVLAIKDDPDTCFSITDKTLTGINGNAAYIGEVHTQTRRLWDYRRDRVISQPYRSAGGLNERRDVRGHHHPCHHQGCYGGPYDRIRAAPHYGQPAQRYHRWPIPLSKRSPRLPSERKPLTIWNASLTWPSRSKSMLTLAASPLRPVRESGTFLALATCVGQTVSSGLRTFWLIVDPSQHFSPEKGAFAEYEHDRG